MTNDRRLLTRVLLRNYKSIAACDVSPAQLSFLVGRNGSGKSNFLDALRFVSESLRYSVGDVLRDRREINGVLRRSVGRPRHFGVRVEFNLEDSGGHFAFSVGAKPHGAYDILREECYVFPRSGARSQFYRVERSRIVKSTVEPHPAARSNHLYLPTVLGFGDFGSVYDALSGTRFYRLNLEGTRNPQPFGPEEFLKPNGSNVASVLSNLFRRSPDFKRRIEEYLGKILPGVVGVNPRLFGAKEILEFRQQIRGAKRLLSFDASSMSDGALRAVCLLVALFQGAENGNSGRRLVGIVEPVAGLHPATVGVLNDALRDAAEHAQIFATTHSADLLDNNEISAESILVAVAEQGESRIGPLNQVGRSVLRDRLYTAGELLRMDQLYPDPDLAAVKPGQRRLFGPVL